jgi:hypothetical protein
LNTIKKHKASAVNQNKPKSSFTKTGENNPVPHQEDFFQPKLKVNEPGDKFEQEADRVADSFINGQKGSSSPFFRSEDQISRSHLADGIFIQKSGLLEIPTENIQRNTGSSSSVAPDSSFSSQLDASKGDGESLPEGLKGQMENHMGTSFDHVKVHHDNTASTMNTQIGAKAFAHGSDVYFNSGYYQPETQEGQHLIAHELTHTVQQTNGLQRELIQRDGDDNTTGGPVNELSVTQGEYTDAQIKKQEKELKIPKVSLPALKSRNSSKYDNPSLYENGEKLKVRSGARGATNQVENWKSEVANEMVNALNTLKTDATNTGGVLDNIYYFKLTNNSSFLLFGDNDALLERLKIPFWDKAGQGRSFQVDHIVEDQLGGVDNKDNYELLDASANMSAGSSLGSQINTRIREALEALTSEKARQETAGNPLNITIPTSHSYVKRNYKVTFNEADYSLATSGETGPNGFWSLEEVKNNKNHIQLIQPLSGQELEAMENESEPKVFFSESGGMPRDLPQNKPAENWIPRVNLIDWSIDGNATAGQNAGSLSVEVFKAGGQQFVQNSTDSVFEWQLVKIPGIYGGAIQKSSVLVGMRNSLRLPGMSPIRIDQLDFGTNGLIGRGKILPTLSIIEGLEIDLTIDGADVQLSKTFSIEELQVPPPFEISQCDLTVFYSTARGLGVEGRVDFGINNVGTGFLGAAASTQGGFELGGEFNFDSQMFDPARIDFNYSQGAFSIGGTLGIPRGKVPGIKSATITAAYAENQFSAGGSAELDIPGVESGTLNAAFSDEGWSIGGRFNLSSDVPGIRSGSVEASISRNEGEEGYQITATGTAQPDIPGIDSSLSISYDNGIITLSGSAAYSRGMLSGTVNVGVTNSEIDDNNQPTGTVSNTLKVYGGGSLTLTLTPWLQASAGVQFLPNGEMEISGRIGIPDTVNVFDRKQFDRSLFRAPTLQIPIFAIPLGPRSIGIVATINGGLSLSAGFGPGQLQQLYGEITYNPDHPEQTTLSGGGRFVIPADAGLRLSADVGVGASVAIASVTGGVEIAGTLGLEGEAAASVDVNWTPADGLTLDALGSITVNPKFTFDVNALLRASLDLWVTSLSKEWRYNLASFSWGPDIQFGVRFPIHYVEGEPFDISFDDVQFVYPDIDIIGMARGLATDVKNRIF